MVDQKKVITEMISPEGEVIKLPKNVQTMGDVDLWLGDIEQQMKQAVKNNLIRKYNEYQKTVQDQPMLE